MLMGRGGIKMGIKMAMEERKSLLERFSFSDNSLIKSRLGSCVIA